MKIIKYQLMTEVKNAYQIPIEEEVEKTIETAVPREVDGEIVMETVTETVTETVVTGYEEKVEVEQIFSDVEIRCTEANFDANYAIAEKEAYGEITVEDDGEGEIKPTPTLETRVATLEESNAEMIETLDMILSGVTEDE